MKKILSLCLLVLFISVPSFSYDLKKGESLKIEIISIPIKEDDSLEDVKKPINEFIKKVGQENIFDIQMNTNVGFANVMTFLIVYKTKA